MAKALQLSKGDIVAHVTTGGVTIFDVKGAGKKAINLMVRSTGMAGARNPESVTDAQYFVLEADCADNFNAAMRILNKMSNNDLLRVAVFAVIDDLLGAYSFTPARSFTARPKAA